jgi:hypothetical protein
MTWGVVFATLYIAFAVAIWLICGEQCFSDKGVSPSAVVVAYGFAGIAGGIVLGAVRPLFHSWLGRAFGGVIVAFLPMVAIVSAMAGPIWRWEQLDWETAIVLSLLFGAIGSLVVHRVFRD